MVRSGGGGAWRGEPDEFSLRLGRLNGMKRQTFGRLVMLAAVPFIMVLGNSMLIPVLPTIQSRLGLSKFEVGLIITIFSIPAGLTIPFAGALSDRLGRKAVMVPALVVYGLGGLVAGVAALIAAEGAYLPIMVGRFIQGIGAGGTYQLAMALAGDIFQSRERTRALGLLEASNGLGKVVSPIAGAAASLIAWFAPFFLYGLLSMPIAAGVWWLVREPGRPAGSCAQQGSLRQYFGRVGGVFRDKGASLAASFLAGALVLFVLFGMLSYYSDVLEDRHGVDGFRKGLVIAGPVLAMAVTSYIAGTVLQRRLLKLIKLLVVVGLALVAGGLALAALVPGGMPLFAAMAVIGLGNGLVLPSLNTMITSAAESESRGAITALYGTVRFFGVAVGPPAFGLTEALGQLPVILSAAALSAAVGALAVWLIDQEKMMPASLLQGGDGWTTGPAPGRRVGERFRAGSVERPAAGPARQKLR